MLAHELSRFLTAYVSLLRAEADAETSGVSAARPLLSPHHGRAFAGLIAVPTVQTMFVLSGVWHGADH